MTWGSGAMISAVLQAISKYKGQGGQAGASQVNLGGGIAGKDGQTETQPGGGASGKDDMTGKATQIKVEPAAGDPQAGAGTAQTGQKVAQAEAAATGEAVTGAGSTEGSFNQRLRKTHDRDIVKHRVSHDAAMEALMAHAGRKQGQASPVFQRGRYSQR